MSTARTPLRLPLPPFNMETTTQKVRMAEDAWNTRDPARVAQACTPGSQRRIASINDLTISTGERKFLRPIGRRPEAHAGLGGMGL